MDIADSYVLRESEKFMAPIHSDAMIDKKKLGNDAEAAVFPVQNNWLQLQEEEEKKEGGTQDNALNEETLMANGDEMA